MPSVSGRVVPAGQDGSEGLGSPTGQWSRRGVRIAVASLVLFAAFLGMSAAGYFYINRVAAGVGRVPVMFAPAPAASRPVPDAARSRPVRQR
jgi:hypothetical protein